MSSIFSAPPAQDDQVVTGGWLSSTSSNYLVQSFLGQGTFGKVAKCKRIDDMKTVAIKMIKNEATFMKSVKSEVSTLLRLTSLDSDKCNFVRWYQIFSDRGHTCFVFEHLDKSLYDFWKERNFQTFLLQEIRPIVQQLANALDHLKAVGIIHADLKLENVMLVDHVREPYRVKVIDFGLACEVKTAKSGAYIQTRPYRSPEIILGLPFTEAIDMWSLGCLAAILFLGSHLYPGVSEYDVMWFIVETQGQPPDHLLNMSHLTKFFFRRDQTSTSTSLWKLKTPEQFYEDSGIQLKETRSVKLSSLDDLLHSRLTSHDNYADNVAEMIDLLMFVDMLKKMLNLDAAERITPSQLLKHHFISMCHIASMYSLSSHVMSCFSMMRVCHLNQTSDSENAVQQPSSRTLDPVLQDTSSSPAESSGLSQPHDINPRPCTSTSTTSSVKSGMKRKVVEDSEDGNKHETSHHTKRVKLGWHRYTHQHQAQPLHHSTDTHHSKISQTQSYNRPSMKRKMADGQDETDSDRYQRPHEDRKRFRESYEGPSTSGCRRSSCTQSGINQKRTQDNDSHSHYYERTGHQRNNYAGVAKHSSHNFSTHSLHVRPDRWSSPAEHHRCRTQHASSTQTKSQALSGLKRKAADDDDDDVDGAWPRKRTSDLRSENERKRNVVFFEERRRRRRLAEAHIDERRTSKQ